MENKLFNEIQSFLDSADKELPIIVSDDEGNEYEFGFIPVEKRNENGVMHYRVNIVRKSVSSINVNFKLNEE